MFCSQYSSLSVSASHNLAMQMLSNSRATGFQNINVHFHAINLASIQRNEWKLTSWNIHADFHSLWKFVGHSRITFASSLALHLERLSWKLYRICTDVIIHYRIFKFQATAFRGFYLDGYIYASFNSRKPHKYWRISVTLHKLAAITDWLKAQNYKII